MVPLPRKTAKDLLKVPKLGAPSGTSSADTSEVGDMFEDGWDKPTRRDMHRSVNGGRIVNLDSSSEESAVDSEIEREYRDLLGQQNRNIVGDPAQYYDDVELEFGSGGVSFADTGQTLAELRRQLSADSDSSKLTSNSAKQNGDPDEPAAKRQKTSGNSNTNPIVNINDIDEVPSLGSMLNNAFANDLNLSPMGASSGDENSDLHIMSEDGSDSYESSEVENAFDSDSVGGLSPRPLVDDWAPVTVGTYGCPLLNGLVAGQQQIQFPDEYVSSGDEVDEVDDDESDEDASEDRMDIDGEVSDQEIEISSSEEEEEEEDESDEEQEGGDFFEELLTSDGDFFSSDSEQEQVAKPKKVVKAKTKPVAAASSTAVPAQSANSKKSEAELTTQKQKAGGKKSSKSKDTAAASAPQKEATTKAAAKSSTEVSDKSSKADKKKEEVAKSTKDDSAVEAESSSASQSAKRKPEETSADSEPVKKKRKKKKKSTNPFAALMSESEADESGSGEEETESESEDEGVTAAAAASKAKASMNFVKEVGTKKNIEGVSLEILALPTDAKSRKCGHGELVKCGYEGYLTQDKRKGRRFDEGTIEFLIGAGEMIPGFEKGCAGLQKGERRRLHIPWRLGYGRKGNKPKIPSCADLIFDIHCIRVGPDWDDQEGEKRNNMSKERREKAKRQRRKNPHNN